MESADVIMYFAVEKFFEYLRSLRSVVVLIQACFIMNIEKVGAKAQEVGIFTMRFFFSF